MSYNSEFIAKPELIGRAVSVNFRYENLVAIANLLTDLHKELDKPEGVRFLQYPQKTLEPVHQDIHNMCVNVILSIEKAVLDG